MSVACILPGFLRVLIQKPSRSRCSCGRATDEKPGLRHVNCAATHVMQGMCVQLQIVPSLGMRTRLYVRCMLALSNTGPSSYIRLDLAFCQLSASATSPGSTRDICHPSCIMLRGPDSSNHLFRSCLGCRERLFLHLNDSAYFCPLIASSLISSFLS